MAKRKKPDPAPVLTLGATVTVTVSALDAALAYACWDNHPDSVQNVVASKAGYEALVRVLKQLLAATGVDRMSPEFQSLLEKHGFDT